MFNLLLIPISAVLFGGLWGYIQGMIMIQSGDYMAPCYSRDLSGVRAHINFGTYHRLCIYCLLAFAELTILWAMHLPEVIWSPLLRYLVFSLGCGLLAWETAECFYSFARYGQYIGPRENINVADIVSWRPNSYWTRWLHLFRWCGGGTIIIVAMFWQ